MSGARIMLCSLWLLVGCSGRTTDKDGPEGAPGDGDVLTAGDDDGDAAPGDPAVDPRPVFQTCDRAPLPNGLATEDWQSSLTPVVVTSQGGPQHSAQDVITVAGEPTTIVGKFTYGPFSKDLEGETIEVWRDDCSGAYIYVGRAETDSDGRIALPLDVLPPVGAYGVYLRVVGDNTYTRSTLRVVLPETKLIVFDIDATLTTDDIEVFEDVLADLFEPIGAGDYVPEARTGAKAITDLRRFGHGYLLVYLTGRPYLITPQTREWLADTEMAPGHLRVTNQNSEVMPNDDAVGTYKAEYLAFLKGLGLELWAAYGNAPTDIYAYGQAEIPPARTFILGDHGGEAGTVALGEDYVDHLVDIAEEAPAAQPFRWQ